MESLTEMNSLMPSLIENGTKFMQLDALKLLAKIHLKIGSIKLEKESNQEEI
jgi:hypothetical protein